MEFWAHFCDRGVRRQGLGHEMSKAKSKKLKQMLKFEALVK